MSEILVPGMYSMVSTVRVVCPQCTRGVFTHGVSLQLRRNLRRTLPVRHASRAAASAGHQRHRRGQSNQRDG